MKYLVLFNSTVSTTAWRYNSYKKSNDIHSYEIATLSMEAFDDETEAVKFCKVNNGYIVKALDLVLEAEEES